MLTEETQEKADNALDVLGDVSEAAKADAKAAKKRKKVRAQRVAAAEHALRVIRNGAADEDAEDDHIILQNSPDEPVGVEPPKAAEPVPAEEPAPEPRVVERVVEKVVDPNPDLQAKLAKAEEELAAARKEAEELKKVEDEPEPVEPPKAAEPVPAKEPAPEPRVVERPPVQPTAFDQAIADANPAQWGWPALVLGVLGVILGWHLGGNLDHWAQHSMHIWQWFAWCAKPIFAALGFFLVGLIGFRLTKRRPTGA